MNPIVGFRCTILVGCISQALETMAVFEGLRFDICNHLSKFIFFTNTDLWKPLIWVSKLHMSKIDQTMSKLLTNSACTMIFQIMYFPERG